MDEATSPVKSNKNNVTEEIFDWIESILFGIFIVSLVFTFILRTVVVIGDSMQPTLQPDNKLIISNIMYKPEQEDIVIVNSEILNEAIVKRIIATEGQTVDINFDEGKVFVDGMEQAEDYINELTYTDLGGHKYPVTVPKGCYFVMGDNRNRSTDSRSPLVGFVEKKDILGRVMFRIFPFNKFGTIK